MKKLTPEGRIIICKTISISKIVFLSFIITASKHILNELEKKQKAFPWKNSTPKVKMKLFVRTIRLEG